MIFHVNYLWMTIISCLCIIVTKTKTSTKENLYSKMFNFSSDESVCATAPGTVI